MNIVSNSIVFVRNVLFLIVFTFLQNSKCMPVIEPRITDGSDARPDSAPFIVSLQINNVHQCGGTIIGENWILTAAHCIPTDSSIVQKIVINAGRYDLKNDKTNRIQLRKIDKFKCHKLYIGGTSPYDIALLYTKIPFKWTTYVKPLKLPNSNVIPNGDGNLYGWGSTSKTSVQIFPNKLQTAIMKILTFNECEKILNKITPGLNLHDTNFCTGSYGKSICTADSGGPLVNKNNDIILGIVSWGIKPCANPPESPSIYVKVSDFIVWIKDTQKKLLE